MVAAVNDARTTSPVFLLCPKCQKRLPLSGSLSIRGSVGIYCRNCHRTVRLSMDVVDTDPVEDNAQNQ